MAKAPTFHPKAYLRSRRNVRAGLISRTKILVTLESARKKASQIANETGLSYECVAYHLKAMRKDRLVETPTHKKPFLWQLTPFGQQKLPTQ